MPKKLTNKEYISKLLINKISIKPLEDYLGQKIKILHKCICDTPWKVRPDAILRGDTCGCSKKLKKTYEETLLERNILVKPLEIYKNNATKILHRCTCNNEWTVTPNHVLQGVKCGCKNTENKFSFYEGEKTLLYYIKVNQYFKIGIAKFKDNINKTIKNRYSADNKVHIEILKTKIFEDGKEAYIKEQQIIEKFSKYKYNGDKILRGGNTEIFIKNIFDKELKWQH